MARDPSMKDFGRERRLYALMEQSHSWPQPPLICGLRAKEKYVRIKALPGDAVFDLTFRRTIHTGRFYDAVMNGLPGLLPRK